MDLDKANAALDSVYSASSPDELANQMQTEQRKWAGVLDQAIVK